MIIGNGMIANAFMEWYAHDHNVVIFASGVSNSNEQNDLEFQLENRLLSDCLAKNSDKKIVYFSTCSIYDKANTESPYVQHKKKMEKLIINNSNNYLIFRLPQVVGVSTNNHTLINYICNIIRSGQPVTIWNGAMRNLIDVEDVAQISNYIIRANYTNNSIINIASKYNIAILDIVRELEMTLNIKANIMLEEKTSSYLIDISEISPIVSMLGIDFSKDYYKRVIRKYYYN